MKVSRLYASADAERWRLLLDSLPLGCRDVYFHPDYHELHTLNGDATGVCDVVSEGQNVLAIPSLHTPINDEKYDLQTCNGYGGPVASVGADSDFLERAWTAWRAAQAENGAVAALFKLHPLLKNERWLPRDANIITDRSTVFLSLRDGLEASRSRSKPRHRNMLSKARRSGCEVRWDHANDWQDFVSLYLKAMDRLDCPEHLKFSDLYFEMLKRLPKTRIAAIRSAGVLSAAAIYIYGQQYAHYHLSARRPDAENFFMNVLIDSGLEVAAEKGLAGLHLGGGRTSSATDNLLNFKKSLGGHMLDFNVALCVISKKQFQVKCEEWQTFYGQKPRWLLGYRQPAPSPVH